MYPLLKMVKITNAVLAEKIDNIHETLDRVEIEVRTVKGDVKTNTEFRLKVNSIIVLVGIIATFVGGTITAIVSKLWR